MGSSKDHFLDFRVLLPGSQKYFREYLCENKNIFKNILGYCSRAQVLSIHAKNQSSKISCHSPFKLIPWCSICMSHQVALTNVPYTDSLMKEKKIGQINHPKTSMKIVPKQSIYDRIPGGHVQREVNFKFEHFHAKSSKIESFRAPIN